MLASYEVAVSARCQHSCAIGSWRLRRTCRLKVQLARQALSLCHPAPKSRPPCCCSACALLSNHAAHSATHHTKTSLRDAYLQSPDTPTVIYASTAVRTCSVRSSHKTTAVKSSRQTNSARNNKAQHTSKSRQQASDQDWDTSRQNLATKAASQARRLDPAQRVTALQSRKALPEPFAVAAAHLLVSLTRAAHHLPLQPLASLPSILGNKCCLSFVVCLAAKHLHTKTPCLPCSSTRLFSEIMLLLAQRQCKHSLLHYHKHTQVVIHQTRRPCVLNILSSASTP